MKSKFYLFFIFLISQAAFAQTPAMRYKLASLAAPARGKVGVAYSVIEDNQTYYYNGHGRMVMRCIAKLPIAMAALRQIDQGQWSLTQKIHVTKEDLYETYSPLRIRYPEGDVDVTVGDLLNYMVTLSDNNASDILVKALGGTQVVQDYVYKLGIKGIEIKASEQQMASSWLVQYNNWCEPVEVVKLLNIIYDGTALSKASNDHLLKLMMETNGDKRIKGLLPRDVAVAHKPATGPTNAWGLTPATNDVGIITLPNGKHLAVAVFITDGLAKDQDREQVIAQISRAIYDDAVQAIK